MSKKIWLNLGLLLLVAGLAWVAYQEPGLDAPDSRTHLTQLTPEQITQISIKRAGKEALLFVKENGWQMHAPANVRANQFRIDSILKLVQAEWRGQFDVADLDLAKYQLDDPLVRITFNNIEIDFGGNEPLNRDRYVRMGRYVYLINDTLYYQLLAGPETFIALTLLPPGSILVGIERPDLTIENEQGRWIVKSGKDSLTPEQINKLVDDWQNAQAIRVSRYENEATQGEIILRLAAQPGELKFVILQRDPELVIAREDTGMAYHFTMEQTKSLLSMNTVGSASGIAE